MQTGTKELIVKTLDPLVGELASLHAKAHGSAQASRAEAGKAVDFALRCGQLLIQAKEQLGHGQYKKWLADNERDLGFSYRTSCNYVRLSNVQALAHLPKAEAETMKLRDAYRYLGIMPAKPKLGERIGASKASRVTVRINTPVKLANDLRMAVVRLRRDGKKAKDLTYLRGLYAELRSLFGDAKS